MQNHVIYHTCYNKCILKKNILEILQVLLHVVTFIIGGAAVGVGKCKHKLSAQWVTETPAVTSS